MSTNKDRKSGDDSRASDLENALDRSDRELKLLANFYHQHGYLDRAQEIYRTMLKIREERTTEDVMPDEDYDQERSA